MTLNFLQLINSIEAEIKIGYLPDAIRWCDEIYDHAWSRAIDRFDRSLAIAIERQDYQHAKQAGEFYKNTVLDLLHKYKSHHHICETKSFLESIRSV